MKRGSLECCLQFLGRIAPESEVRYSTKILAAAAEEQRE
jgi:hypothetical protein